MSVLYFSDTVKELMDAVAGQAPSKVRVEFNAGANADMRGFRRETAEIFRNQTAHLTTSEGVRIGHNAGYYGDMAGSIHLGEAAVHILEDVILPLKNISREAFNEGMRRMQEDSFTAGFDGQYKQVWLESVKAYDV